jgi:hypothetical protein
MDLEITKIKAAGIWNSEKQMGIQEEVGPKR